MAEAIGKEPSTISRDGSSAAAIDKIPKNQFKNNKFVRLKTAISYLKSSKKNDENFFKKIIAVGFTAPGEGSVVEISHMLG